MRDSLDAEKSFKGDTQDFREQLDVVLLKVILSPEPQCGPVCVSFPGGLPSDTQTQACREFLVWVFILFWFFWRGSCCVFCFLARIGCLEFALRYQLTSVMIMKMLA